MKGYKLIRADNPNDSKKVSVGVIHFWISEIRRVSEIILKYNHIFIKKMLKFIFHNTNYIPQDSVQCRESDSAKIIGEITKKKKKLVNIN